MSKIHKIEGTFILEALFVRLITEDWNSPDYAMKLNAGLTLDDLQAMDFYRNVRIFLQALADEDGTPATATGNLNREFIRRLFDRIIIPQDTRDMIIKFYKVMNERDIWLLHIVRVISDTAKLISLRKKRFQLTKLGRSMLDDDHVGELYHRLFVAYFRRFDLGYDFQWRTVPGIQDTIAVILWMLESIAQEWTPVLGLAPQILLPAIHEQLLAAMTYEFDREEWILDGYVLNPLGRLGLLERRGDMDARGIPQNEEIRISPLWRKFISFQQSP